MSALFLAPMVIAKRMPQLLFEAFHPNPMVSDESRRAVTEKMEALSEGMLAAHAEAMSTPFRMGQAFFSGDWSAMTAMNTPQRMAKAAIKPMERRVKANAKRLSKPFTK